MDCLEDITTRMHDGYYVDLFVRASNKTAIQMYTKVRMMFIHVRLQPCCFALITFAHLLAMASC
jgi:ribosomal protein S18 acetylase RimI-like enzyme